MKVIRMKRVNKSLKSPPHRGVIGNGSEIPTLTRQDLIDRGMLVAADKIAEGLTVRRLPGKRQWMHTASDNDLSPLYVGEDIEGCGYCMGGILHSFDLHDDRLFKNGVTFRMAA